MKTKVFNATENPHFRSYGDYECVNPWTFTIDIDGHILLPRDFFDQMGFSSEKEAQIYLNTALDKLSDPDNVFVVLKNNDFTEGRGPMIFDKVFKTAKSAYEYVMNEKGIYGSNQYQQINFGVSIKCCLYGSVTYNGYNIIMSTIK